MARKVRASEWRNAERSDRGILAEVKGILTIVVVLVAVILIFIDIAYVIALVIIVAGFAFALLVPDKKLAAPLGAAAIFGGILYALYLTQQGAMALSTVKGVP